MRSVLVLMRETIRAYHGAGGKIKVPEISELPFAASVVNSKITAPDRRQMIPSSTASTNSKRLKGGIR